ncbi:MAG TPA: hypothetical protein PKL57_07975, partial [Candidatus Wallbacteria bacterium]|nr:hypothetical protein [Candidatus Wallbacteria bacterium]
MVKKYLALLIIAALMFGLLIEGCGKKAEEGAEGSTEEGAEGSASEGGEGGDVQEASRTAPAPAAAPPPAAAPA